MEKVRGRLLQELRGKCTNFFYKIKKIFYTDTREFDNVQAIYLSEIPFHLILSKIFKFLATRCQILRLNASNSISTGALPQTPLGELTALPRPSSRI